eukprot:TRINITY_DN86542_c0_g1_i1.p1 TRINITY_DN86542_c0_g1~~TRINITY_DN86542_c0_g1_i1.p1  ORF type:complete len:313 (+),score=39.38 TRINITY_DN86542_c0_g1_i1:36-974(+)
MSRTMVALDRSPSDPVDFVHSSDDSGTSSSSEEEQHLLHVPAVVGNARTFAHRLHHSHSKFFANSSLSLSVAFWIMLLGIPVITHRGHFLIFGSRGELAKAKNAQLHDRCKDMQLPDGSWLDPNCNPFKPKPVQVYCDSDDIGQVGISKEAVRVHWNTTTGHWDTDSKNGIWCGYALAGLASSWPNIAQFIVFTVLATTGDTVKLAWQGTVGTLAACANVWLMSSMYLEGAQGAYCGSDGKLHGKVRGIQLHGECKQAPYNEFVCLVDVVLVLFLFFDFRRSKEYSDVWYVLAHLLYDDLHEPFQVYSQGGI